MNQAKIEENKKRKRKKRVKVGDNNVETRWKLGNLQPKIFPLSTQLPKPNITSLKDLIDFAG